MRRRAVCVWLLFTAGMACSGGQPGAPDATSRSEETIEAFVAVAQYGGGPGIGPAMDRLVRISASGEIQSSTIRDERVVELQEKSADTAPLLRGFDVALPGLPRAFVERGEGRSEPDAPIPDYVRIVFRSASGGSYDWAGYEVDLAAAHKELLGKVFGISLEAPVTRQVAGGAYIAAFPLQEGVAARLRREGAIRSVDASRPARPSALETSLRHPFRLVPVAPGANPFHPLVSRFQPGRSTLEVSYSGVVFQVRSYATSVSP